MTRPTLKLSDIYLILALLMLMLAALFLGVGLLAHKPTFDRLRLEGKQVDAMVWEKLERSERCGRTSRQVPISCTNAILSVRYTVGGRSEAWDLGKVSIQIPVLGSGATYTAQLRVSRARFDATNVGDKVPLIYLPQDPSLAKEAQLVKTWTVWESVVYGLVCLVLAAIFARLMVRRRRLEQPNLAR